jgi:Flp pilus assembly protein TadD
MARAFLAIEANDDSRAIRELRLASQRAPFDPVAPSLLGEILAKTDLEAAQTAVEEALRRDPFSVRSLAASGLIALALEEHQVARDRLEELERISPLADRPEARALRDAIDRDS